MALNWNFPIRYKILAVLSVVVCAAVAVYLYLASRIFYEDKTLLIYELNQGNVRVLAKEMDSFLKNASNQMKLFVDLGARDGEKNSAYDRVRDESVVAMRARDSSTGKTLLAREWLEGLKPYIVSAPDLEEMLGSDEEWASADAVAGLKQERIQLQGFWRGENAEKSWPLISVRQWIEPSYIVTALVRVDSLLSLLDAGGIAQVYVLGPDGKMLLSAPDQSGSARAGGPSAGDPLFSASKVGRLRSEVKRFEWGGKRFLGSWYRGEVLPFVAASRVEVGEAFAAARVLIRKSLIYAAIIVTAAFMIALLFSHTLTDPIHKMLEATYRVARGDFNSLIHIKSHDELAVLAASFNTMTVDLRSSRSQIEEYSRDLEKKVQDRTMRLETQNVAIREAQEALIRTTRLASVGEVAGRAAHEVLNPLTNIIARLEKNKICLRSRGAEDFRVLHEALAAWKQTMDSKGVEGLLEDFSRPSAVYPGRNMIEEDMLNFEQILGSFKEISSQWSADLEFLLGESNRISKIVNGMRSLTRVSGNRRKLSVGEISKDAFNASHDALSRNAIEHAIEGGDEVFVYADRDELLQVVTNLVRNSMQAIVDARQAGPPLGGAGKIWIRVSVAETDQGRRCHWRICDNGPGIGGVEGGSFEKIFEPSFTTKTVDEGTGLGLSIARRFIRAYDGELTVEKSVPGVETVFLVDLPVYTGEGAVKS